jgi:P27 family predicted phage terminase small subunit
MPANRVPTKLKIMRGTLKADRRNQHEAKPLIVSPRCPPELQGEALKEWRRMAPKLTALGLLSEIDSAIFTAYCGAWARYLEAQTLLREQGLMAKGARGAPILNPLLAVVESSAGQLRRLGCELGLSPASRSKVQAVPVAPITAASSEAEEKFFGPMR